MATADVDNARDVLKSSSALLDAHETLLRNLEAAQERHRAILARFPSPPPGLGARSIVPETSVRERKRSFDESTEAKTGDKNPNASRADLPPIKRIRAERYANYSPEEETIRNDYSQQYVDSGEWPQNYVQGAEPERRFEEYPKQQRLLNLKKQAVASTAHPPTYLPFSSLPSLTASSAARFDVILIDPPFSSSFTWDTLANLPVPALAADPSFVFLWVGSGAGDGLERGRETLYRWGYRRCEDVVWIKTNTGSNCGPGTDPPTSSAFVRTKEHCLIGIRGTVRRSTDSWFVHCNVDTDVMFWEGDPSDPTRKPPETYTLIENFCLGLRRLELFGRAPHSLRPGWVTVAEDIQDEDLDPEIGAVPWESGWWEDHLADVVGGTAEASGGMSGRYVVPTTPDIELLRPKSPVPRGGGGGGGRPSPMQGGGAHNSSFPSGSRGPTFGAMAGHAGPSFGMQHQHHQPIAGGPRFQSQHQRPPPHFQNYPTPFSQQQPGQFIAPHPSFQHQQPPFPQHLAQFGSQTQSHSPSSQQQQQLNVFAAPFVPGGPNPSTMPGGPRNPNPMAFGAPMGMGMDPSMNANMIGMGGPMSMGFQQGSGPGMGMPFDGGMNGMNMQNMDPAMLMQMQAQMQMMGGDMSMGPGMGGAMSMDPSFFGQQQQQSGPQFSNQPFNGGGAQGFMGPGPNGNSNMGMSGMSNGQFGGGSGMAMPMGGPMAQSYPQQGFQARPMGMPSVNSPRPGSGLANRPPSGNAPGPGNGGGDPLLSATPMRRPGA